MGQEHIASGEIAEGYGICDGSDMKAIEYYDYAEYGDSGNWGGAKRGGSDRRIGLTIAPHHQ